MIFELLVVVVLIALNGLFSGAEMAIVSVRRTRVDDLVSEGSASARLLAVLKAHPERFLATVQVGITVVGATAAAFGGSTIALRLTPWIAQVPGLAEQSEELALAAVVTVISVLSIVLGELVPKSLALRNAETLALLVAGPMSVLAWVARPAVWVLTAVSNAILSVFGDHTSFRESRLSTEELQQLVDEAADAGTLDRGAGEIASRALDFATLDAATVMVPRRDVVSLHRDAGIDALAEVVRNTGRTRVLLHGGDLDGVLGFVHARDALAAARLDPNVRLQDLVHPAPFVPDTMPAMALLRLLQAQRVRLAVVVDEQGGVRGIVGIEDLVEELVGEILSEDDVVVERLRVEPDGSLLVQADLPIHEVERALDLDLPETMSASTIGGLCTELAGHIPRAGEQFEAGPVDLVVLDSTPRRVKSLRVVLRDPAPS